MVRRLAVLVLLAVAVAVAVVGCSDGDTATKPDDSGGSTTTNVVVGTDTTVQELTAEDRLRQAAAEGPAPTCVGVELPLRAALGLPGAVAVRAPDDVHLQPEDTVWYVSDGAAIWATNLEPQGEAASGLVVPVNDEARAASEVGRNFSPEDFDGVDGDSGEAIAAKVCATED